MAGRCKYSPAILVLLVCIAGFCTPVFGQGPIGKTPSEPFVSLKADHQEIKVGDEVEITMIVGYPTNYSTPGGTRYPKVEGLNQLGMDRFYVSVANRFRTEETTRNFQAVKAGEYTIEPVTMQFRSPAGKTFSAESNALMIVVLEAEAAREGLRDIKGLKPIKRPVDWLLMITIAAIALTIILIVLIVARRRSRTVIAHEPGRFRRLEEEFIAKLEEIIFPEEFDSEAVKKIYLLMSELVRTYLNRQWNIDAREATTKEILEEMNNAGYDREALAKYSDMGRAFDMVKYAKGRPYKIDMEDARQAAIEFIQLLAGSGDRRGTYS